MQINIDNIKEELWKILMKSITIRDEVTLNRYSLQIFMKI